MRSIFYLFISVLFFSCGGNKKEVVDLVTSTSKTDSLACCYKEPKANELNLQFLGHQIRCSNENLSREFVNMCNEDRNLSYDSINQNITLYGTTFHLNYSNRGKGFMLMTSVQPDSRQIKIVRDAISKFHGKENFEEDDHYLWLPFTDSTKMGQNYPIIHLRRVRSEEGGTAIIVN